MNRYAYTNQRALRAAYWETIQGGKRGLRNRVGRYPTDIYIGWCDFIEHLSRDGQISEALASRATLEP